MKSGNLNFLEPSGPLQDCNGFALPSLSTAFHCQFSTQCHLLLRLPISNVLPLPEHNALAAYIFFLVFPSIFPYTFPSITCFRRQFLRQLWPIKLAFLLFTVCRVQLKCDGTRWRTEGEVEGKLANGVGSQYSSHYLGTWCIQLYYRWCVHLGCQ